jgi:hypothetical protein
VTAVGNLSVSPTNIERGLVTRGSFLASGFESQRSYSSWPPINALCEEEELPAIDEVLWARCLSSALITFKRLYGGSSPGIGGSGSDFYSSFHRFLTILFAS